MTISKATLLSSLGKVIEKIQQSFISNESATQLYTLNGFSPNYYHRSQMMDINDNTLIIYETLVNVNGYGCVSASKTSIDLNTTSSWDDSTLATPSNRSNKNIHLFSYSDSGEAKFKLSVLDSIDNHRLIGGFYCGSNGSIVSNTQWDLEFRPISDPDGMIYIKNINRWVDINTSEQTYTFETGSKVLSDLNKSLLSYGQLSNISSNTNLSNITGRYQWVSDIIYTDSVKRLAFGKESSSDISIDDSSGTSLCYIRGCSETKVDGGRN